MWEFKKIRTNQGQRWHQHLTISDFLNDLLMQDGKISKNTFKIKQDRD